MEIKKEVCDYARKMYLISLILDITFDFAESMTVSTELKNGEKQEVDVKQVIKEIIGQQFRLLTPYKFEELSLNMFMYDAHDNYIYQIVDIQCGETLLLYNEGAEDGVDIVHFEKNRFYPVITFKDLLLDANVNDMKESIQLKQLLEYGLLTYFLKQGFKYLARDKSNDLAIFKEKPLKNENLGVWNNTDETYIDLCMFNDLFIFVTWEDEEARDIKSILENCVVNGCDENGYEKN